MFNRVYIIETRVFNNKQERERTQGYRRNNSFDERANEKRW